jgi:hypothetical protein
VHFFFSTKSISEIAKILPNSCLITKSGKTADMIFRSSKGVCEGNDFRLRQEKEAGITSGRNLIHPNKIWKI